MSKGNGETIGQKPTKELRILVGIPGSGKSTLASQLVKLGFVRLSADAIRGELYGDEGIQGDGEKVFGKLNALLALNMTRGANIVVDNTNVHPKARKQIIKLGRQYGYHITIVVVQCPLHTAIQRQFTRSRQVPEEAIRRMYDTLLRHYPSESEADDVQIYDTFSTEVV